LTNKLVNIAFIILALVLGAWAWNHYFAKPHITTQYERIERPVFIHDTTVIKQAIPAKPTAESAKHDSILVTAPCDSVRNIARDLGRRDSVVFKEEVAFSDSLASFHATEITTIVHDPWKHIFEKTREYEDAILSVLKVNTTVATTEISWVAVAIATLVGFVIALLIQ